MIYLRMTDLLLSPPVTHTYSDWQVATDLQFTNITAQSLGDKVNLTSILMTNSLDPAVQYYARSRALLSTGYTAWSNIDIFTPQDVLATQTQTLLPSLVSIPTVSITGGTAVSVYNARVTVGVVSTLGGANHIATSYFVEDLNGNLVWTDLINRVQTNGINIPPGALLPNKAYRLRVLVHVDSMDTSQLITQTFRTESHTSGILLGNFDRIDSTIQQLVQVDGTKAAGSSIVVYAMVNNSLTSVFTATMAVGGTFFTIPANTLKPKTKFLLRVNTANPVIWDQNVFYTL